MGNKNSCQLCFIIHIEINQQNKCELIIINMNDSIINNSLNNFFFLW